MKAIIKKVREARQAVFKTDVVRADALLGEIERELTEYSKRGLDVDALNKFIEDLERKPPDPESN